MPPDSPKWGPQYAAVHWMKAMRNKNALRFQRHDEKICPTPSQPDGLRQPTRRPVPSSPGGVLIDTIKLATPNDLKYITDLQKKFSNQLGFLTSAALMWHLENKTCGLAIENGEPAGYVLGRESYKYNRLIRPITQAAVQFDAQRRQHGMNLVNRVIERARHAGQLAVQAKCAADIEANDFWCALGFHAIHVITPTNARERTIIVWRKPTTDQIPTWFGDAPPVTGHKNHHGKDTK